MSGFGGVTFGFSQGNASTGPGSGTVTSVSSGNLSPLFTVVVSSATTTPSFAFTAVNQVANKVYSGPASGVAAAPTFRSLVTADLPSGTVTGSGTTNVGLKWTDGANSIAGDGTWAYNTNDWYPLTDGSNLGKTGTNRIGTIYMASTIDYVTNMNFSVGGVNKFVFGNTGIVTTGTWGASLIAGQFGGTGVANTGKTITLDGNLVTTGAFNTTFVQQSTATITLPSATSTLLANNLGISGGSTLAGGTLPSENLTFTSTSHATKGKILFGTSAYDEVNNRLGIGTISPTADIGVFGGQSVFQNYTQSTIGVGTVTTNGSITLTGTGTTFLSTFNVGDNIYVSGESVRTIATITSDTVLTVSSAFSTFAADLDYTLDGGLKFSIDGSRNLNFHAGGFKYQLASFNAFGHILGSTLSAMYIQAGTAQAISMDGVPSGGQISYAASNHNFFDDTNGTNNLANLSVSGLGVLGTFAAGSNNGTFPSSIKGISLNHSFGDSSGTKTGYDNIITSSYSGITIATTLLGSNTTVTLSNTGSGGTSLATAQGHATSVTHSGTNATKPNVIFGNALTLTANSAGNFATDKFVGESITLKTGASQTGTIADASYLHFISPTFTGSKPTTVYGLQIHNLGVSGVTTSAGLKIDAQSGSTNNYGIIIGGGFNGLNTLTPRNVLEINALTTTDSLAVSAISTGATTKKALVLQGVSSQTANIFELQDSAGTVLTSISPFGDVAITGNDRGFYVAGNGVFSYSTFFSQPAIGNTDIGGFRIFEQDTGSSIDLGNGGSGGAGFISGGSSGSWDFDSNIKLNTVGKGIYIKEGSNATSGVATLIGGTVTVSTTKVTADSRIQLTGQKNATNIGVYNVTARTAGTSFTITSANVLDTNDVAWIIIEKA